MKSFKVAGILIRGAVEAIILVGTIYMVIYLFLFRPGTVKGISMQPTLQNNERFITNMVTYHLTKPKRGEIVVINAPGADDLEYIKRVIAIQGDTLEVRGGEVYLNGKQLSEKYINTKTFPMENGYIKEGETVIIPEGSIFVMGDNRAHSLDSRSFGPVKQSEIIGRAAFRYFPYDKIGTIKSVN